MNKLFYNIQKDFPLELGGQLKNPTVAYTTIGKLSPNKDNVVWVFHALTAAANVEDWWNGLVGNGKLFDPEKHFIVCANIRRENKQLCVIFWAVKAVFNWQ